MSCCTEEGLSCIDHHEAHGKNLNTRGLFNVGIVREIVLTTHDPVTDPYSTTLQLTAATMAPMTMPTLSK